MLMAIIGTLMHHEIITYTWIIPAWVIGSLVGLAMGLWVPMTAMPSGLRFACLWRFCCNAGGRFRVLPARGHLDKITMGALGFEVMLGALTTTGSFARFCEVAGYGARHAGHYKGQNVLT